MADKKVTVKIRTGAHEGVFFQDQEQMNIKMLRDKAAHESNKKYREDHKNHCFRCGTQSLVEIKYGSVKVDVCINEKCGAMHLDSGEIEAIVKDQGGFEKLRKAVFDVFK